MKTIVLVLLAPALSLAQSLATVIDNLGHGELETVTTTTTTTTTTVTTTTLATALTPAFKFTSPLLNKIMADQAPASNLPFWYGFRWNRKIHPQLDEWTEFLYKEIDTHGSGLLETNPEGVTNFCPNYEKLNRDERVLFWMKLTTVLMSFESGYDPTKTYDDSSNVGGDEKVISTGLLMLSHESVMPDKYDCNMISPIKSIGDQDLKDPKKNMACGIRVMNYWVKTDKVMADRDETSWKGMARYWGPFRHLMLKKDEDGLWSALLKRVPRWEAESDQRDQFLQQSVKTALQTSGPNIDKKVWEAASSRTPHPSMMEDKYKAEESHKFSSMVRLMNQTGFCYK